MERKLVMYGNPPTEKEIEKFILNKIPDYYKRSWSERKVVLEKLIRACHNCSLRVETDFEPVTPVLNEDCFALFVGRNPCKTEAMENEILPEGSIQGAYFRKYFQMLGLGQSEISVIDMCYCYARRNRPPEQQKMNKCSAFKKFELELIGDKYKIVFAMGNDALRWLFGLNCPGVLQSLGDIYKVVIKGRPVLVVPLVHPNHLAIAPEYKEDTEKILKRCREIIKSLR